MSICKFRVLAQLKYGKVFLLHGCVVRHSKLDRILLSSPAPSMAERLDSASPKQPHTFLACVALGGGEAEARGPVRASSVSVLPQSRHTPARLLCPGLTCCLTVLLQECLKSIDTLLDNVRNIIPSPHSARKSLVLDSYADNPSAVSRPLALRCCYILVLFSKALVPKPWCLNPLFLWLCFLWLWGEMLMLTRFGLIWLPGLIETTCSLLFLLHSPECTFLASLSLGSAARQPTDNSPLVMPPCLTTDLWGRMTKMEVVGERTA